MAFEYCLIHKDKEKGEDFEPAPYTIGWTFEHCEKEARRYGELMEDEIWEVGIREVSPWRVCKRVEARTEEPRLPGFDDTLGKEIK